MAAITKLAGTSIYIKIGDGASPETFAHPCLINAKRGVKFNSNSNKIIVPDCDNIEDPAWTEIIQDGLSMSIDGTGMLDNVLATIQLYDLWFAEGASKNAQVWLGTIGKWVGAFKLTSWNIDGERNAYAAATLSLESTGVVSRFIP